VKHTLFQAIFTLLYFVAPLSKLLAGDEGVLKLSQPE